MTDPEPSTPSNQGLLNQAASLVGTDTPMGRMLSGEQPEMGTTDGDQSMSMAMNQIGSNYFVGGDFIIAEGCAGCGGVVLPEEFDLSQFGGDDNAGAEQSFSMDMSQVGSNYFVMGDYIVGDMEFIAFEEFQKCLDPSGLEGCAEEMKQQKYYDCVVRAEETRRKYA